MIDNRKLASKKTVVNNKQQDLHSEAEVLVSSLRTVPMFNSVMFNKDQYVSVQTYIHTYIHSLFGNAGYRICKTEVLMWTCLSTC